MKKNWKPGTMIYPLPAVLVSCGATPEEYNLLTVAWTGTVCSDPAMCYISVRRERHSYEIIRRSGEFVINLTTEELARATDWCGVRSGRDYDKFAEMGLTPMRASVVAAPVVAEAPVSIECKVRQVIPLGSHDMFLAEVVNVMVDDRYIDASGRFNLELARPLVFLHGEYFKLGELIGGFGWSVRKKPAKQKSGKARSGAGPKMGTSASGISGRQARTPGIPDGVAQSGAAVYESESAGGRQARTPGIPDGVVQSDGTLHEGESASGRQARTPGIPDEVAQSGAAVYESDESASQRPEAVPHDRKPRKTAPKKRTAVRKK